MPNPGTDLTAFLLARLAEDERLARDVIESVGPERAGERFTDDSGDATHDAFPSYPWGAEHAELPFMAGPGHPARVLAEVEAKRVIIEEHRIKSGLSQYEQSYGGHTFGCTICHEFDGIITGDGFCPTLRLLALPYNGHPDYRQEWKL